MTLDLEHLRRVAEAATPGPWEQEGSTSRSSRNIRARHRDGWPLQGVTYGVVCVADAEHVAAFDPPTALALIDRLEAAEATVARVEQILGHDDLECARLGLPCFDVLTEDRWCRGCRLTVALCSDLAASEGDGGPEGHRDDDNAGDGRRGAQEGTA